MDNKTSWETIAIVFLTAIVTALSTIFINWLDKRRIEKETAKDLKNYISELNQLINNTVDKIIDSPLEMNEFSLKHLNKLRYLVDKYESKFEQINLLIDKSLGKRLLQTIENLSETRNTLSYLVGETYDKQKKLDESRDNTLKELRQMKIALLKHNIFIDPADNKTKFTNEEQDALKLKAVDDIINNSGFIDNLKRLNEEIEYAKSANEKERGLYSVKFLNLKNQLDEINQKIISSI